MISKTMISRAAPAMGRKGLAPSTASSVAVRPAVVVRFQHDSMGNKTSGQQTQTSTQTVDKLIIEDHNKVRGLYEKYGKTSDTHQKQEIAFQIIRNLSMHASKEEEVVYPVIKKHFGEEEFNRVVNEHQSLKDNLTELMNMDPDRDIKAFDQKVDRVMQIVKEHITFEEETELPKLMKEPGVDGQKLGRDFEDAATHAVTRPHPWAPNKAPVNWFTNRMTAPLDAAVDAVTGKNKEM